MAFLFRHYGRDGLNERKGNKGGYKRFLFLWLEKYRVLLVQMEAFPVEVLRDSDHLRSVSLHDLYLLPFNSRWEGT